MRIEVQEWGNHIFDKYLLVDVRTPAEFSTGHVCSAINIPLFSNSERVEVGTLYTQQNKTIAFDRGLELVGPKMLQFVKQARAEARRVDKPLAIYCWRGGMRSESMTWLFTMAGIPCVQLMGGYKSYRKIVRQAFTQQANIKILSGRTGSGKTRLLHKLAEQGEQILDLEGLANHMGSSFGYRGDNEQPTNEQFENICFEHWRKFDFQRAIWIEDESQKIGKVFIVDTLYEQMLKAPIFEVKISLQQRIENILADYKDIKKEQLLEACRHIKKRLGGLRYQQAVEFIEAGNYRSAVPILLKYYDSLYDRYAKKHPRPKIEQLPL